MFYEPKAGHGLPRDPWKSCVVPRPIGWISTLGTDGTVNLAPYSFFNAVSDAPPMVAFAAAADGGRPGTEAGGAKDSRTNAEATGAFVVNMAVWALRDAMNASSAPLPPEADEFAAAGLETLPSRLVAPPRVRGAPVHLECRWHQTVELPSWEGPGYGLVIGEVVGIHIDDAALTDGLIDIARLRPIARLGYLDYALVDSVFSMPRPASR